MPDLTSSGCLSNSNLVTASPFGAEDQGHGCDTHDPHLPGTALTDSNPPESQETSKLYLVWALIRGGFCFDLGFNMGDCRLLIIKTHGPTQGQGVSRSGFGFVASMTRIAV